MRTLEQYQDFATIFIHEVMEHVADRNVTGIHELLDKHASPDGEMSEADWAFLGMWRSMFATTPEDFWWVGYALSIREGFEHLLAYLFISSQQVGTPDKALNEQSFTVNMPDGSDRAIPLNELTELMGDSFDNFSEG